MPIASRALKGVHKEDPKKVIAKNLPEDIGEIELLGPRVLCAIYERPNKIKVEGGHEIHLPDSVVKEDEYQGKALLVLAMGKLAFVDDSRNVFGKDENGEVIKPKPGDWIAVRVGDTFQIKLGDQKCRVVNDTDIQMIIPDPDIVY